MRIEIRHSSIGGRWISKQYCLNKCYIHPLYLSIGIEKVYDIIILNLLKGVTIIMQLEFTKSPRSAARYLKIWYAILLLMSLIGVAIGALIWFYNGLPFYGVYIFTGVAIIYSLFFMIRALIIYRYFQYRVTERYIEINKNWWFKHNEVIQIERIQYVKRKSGPLMRHFHLNRLTFYTAGHELDLPLLFDEKINEIERHCLTQLERGDSDV